MARLNSFCLELIGTTWPIHYLLYNLSHCKTRTSINLALEAKLFNRLSTMGKGKSKHERLIGAALTSLSDTDHCLGSDIFLASKAKICGLLSKIPEEQLEQMIAEIDCIERIEFGLNLRRLRQSLGFTLAEMESHIRRLGEKISYTEISELERAKRPDKYNYARLVKLAALLGINSSENNPSAI